MRYDGKLYLLNGLLTGSNREGGTTVTGHSFLLGVQDRGTPPTHARQCTYTMGGKAPLAVTQEDFLVLVI